MPSGIMIDSTIVLPANALAPIVVTLWLASYLLGIFNVVKFAALPASLNPVTEYVPSLSNE